MNILSSAFVLITIAFALLVKDTVVSIYCAFLAIGLSLVLFRAYFSLRRDRRRTRLENQLYEYNY